RRDRVDADELLDARVVHVGEHAVEAERRVVDEAVDRTELAAHVLDEFGDVVEVAEVERHEVQRALVRALRLLHGRADLVVSLSGDRDGAITLASELARDAEAEPAAAA